MKAFVKQHFPAISISRVASEFEVYRKRKDSHNQPGALSGYDFNQVNLGEEKLPNPATYWKYFGEDTPNLQKIAALIYEVQPSSAACERNFAHFEYVYTKRRQRLGTVKGDKIVFVYSNGKMG